MRVRSGLRLVRRRWATAWRLLQSGDLAALTRRTYSFLGRVGSPSSPVDYTQWRRRWVEIDETARARIDELVLSLPYQPTFTVLVPIDGAEAKAVTATVASLTTQRYLEWVLYLTGTGSPDPAIAETVNTLSDSRVRFTDPTSAPLGNWVTRLTAGDLVHEAALFAIAHAITRSEDVAVVYTDHDHVGPDGQFLDPHMKPDWNPDLLFGMDYLGILTAYRTDLWEANATNATSTHDLAIRATTHLDTSQVVHVPHVLASEHVSGDGSHLTPTIVQAIRPLPVPPPRVSIIIPTRNRGRMLERCLKSLRERTDYPDIELVVVDHETTEPYARRILDSLTGGPNVQIISFSGPFNFAAMVNRAAPVATGEVLVLLNNDTEVIEPAWLSELVGQVSRQEVGIAGALLLFADKTIQHAGVHPGVNGLMGHGHKHLPGNHPGYFGRLLVPHEVAAVTGACLAVEATTFENLGGLDEENLAVAYNDVDLCLKARQTGLRVIFNPYARLVHHESASRGVDDSPARNKRLASELSVMQERWGGLLTQDPAYSPNLSLTGQDFTLAEHPRRVPLWR